MSEQERNFQQEADFLAGILEHKEIPLDFRNYIADLVLEIADNVSLYTPEVLRVAWPLIRQQKGLGEDALFTAMVMAFRAFADGETDRLLDEINQREMEKRRRRAAEAAEDDVTKDAETELPRQSTAELAGHLSAVLKHPDTPARLEHAIGRELAAMLDSCDPDTPDMIKRTLKTYKKQKAEEKGGKR